MVKFDSKLILMRNFIFLFLVFIGAMLQGQITINNTHMPKDGDSLRFSLAELDTALITNYQNAGANLTWNFDSLVPIRQGLSEYIASAQSPYNISNRIGEKLADTIDFAGTVFYDAYNFYSSDTSSFSITHRGATAPTGLSFPFPSTLKIAQSYSNADEVYQFPLDYLDRDSSTYDFVYSNTLVNAYVGSSGYRINEVDAWGSLTTPYGTFNCIRVVTDIVGYDTVSSGSTNTRIDSHQREYKWLTTQFEIPALTISGVVDSGIFTPSIIRYRDSVRNVPSIFAPFALFSASDTLIGIGDTVNFSNLSVSFLSTNYKWDVQPTTFQYINGTSATTDSITVVFNDTGFYDVKLVAINSSGKDSLLRENYIRVDQLVGVEDLNHQTNFYSIFPNPAKKGAIISIAIDKNAAVKSIRIYDLSARLLRQILVNPQKQELQFRGPEKGGIYLIQLETKDGLINKRLVVE